MYTVVLFEEEMKKQNVPDKKVCPKTILKASLCGTRLAYILVKGLSVSTVQLVLLKMQMTRTKNDSES